MSQQCWRLAACLTRFRSHRQVIERPAYVVLSGGQTWRSGAWRAVSAGGGGDACRCLLPATLDVSSPTPPPVRGRREPGQLDPRLDHRGPPPQEQLEQAISSQVGVGDGQLAIALGSAIRRGVLRENQLPDPAATLRWRRRSASNELETRCDMLRLPAASRDRLVERAV